MASTQKKTGSSRSRSSSGGKRTASSTRGKGGGRRSQPASKSRPIRRELGGVVAITTAVIIVTGILGNVIGDFIFSIFRIKHPIAKGLALGNSAHAIGTAKAMELGEVEGAMSSLAIAVAGVLTVVSASVFAQFFVTGPMKSRQSLDLPGFFCCQVRGFHVK